MNKQKAKIYNTFLKKKIKLQSSALLDIEAYHKALLIQCGVYTGIDKQINSTEEPRSILIHI